MQMLNGLPDGFGGIGSTTRGKGGSKPSIAALAMVTMYGSSLSASIRRRANTCSLLAFNSSMMRSAEGQSSTEVSKQHGRSWPEESAHCNPYTFWHRMVAYDFSRANRTSSVISLR